MIGEWGPIKLRAMLFGDLPQSPSWIPAIETGTVDALDRIAKREPCSKVGSGRIDRYHARTASMWVMGLDLCW
jgi:hypothetical protein